MDLITCEIRFAEDETRQTPGRLVGTLLTYGERASDRPEVFDPDSIYFPDGGLWINEQHNRQAPILRAMPTLEGRALLVDAALPNTQRGRDAATGLQSDPPLYTGLSLEFKAEKETREKRPESDTAGLCAIGWPGRRSELRGQHSGASGTVGAVLGAE